VARFEEMYEAGAGVCGEAARDWAEVERARGRGRLAREREKQEEGAVGTSAEL
jgi:hypothetical protein